MKKPEIKHIDAVRVSLIIIAAIFGVLLFYHPSFYWWWIGYAAAGVGVAYTAICGFQQYCRKFAWRTIAQYACVGILLIFLQIGYPEMRIDYM